MRATRILGLILWAGTRVRAEECGVAVAMSTSPAVPPATLLQARSAAAGIFGSIGVVLRWGGRAAGCETRIAVKLENGGGPDEQPDSLAYAMVGAGAEKQIHVFMNRVNEMAGQTAAGALLGHVLAHEIAHILEGVPRHSVSGVMKAHWERRDLKELLWHPLRFEPVDEALIHAGLAKELTRSDTSRTGD